MILTLTIAFHIFYDLAAYNRTLSAELFCLGFACVIGYLISVTLFGMVVVHVSQVHEKLHVSNEENMKLLNGMHEGVLILTKNPDEPATAMFCNRSAQKLIKTFFDGGFKTQEEKADSKASSTEYDDYTKFLSKPEFKPLLFNTNR